ncbi:hypothetical protein SASPL_100999 [Salvia splendens]|uniref:Uncharacterized protein n=1 Tax=Salvia splendens TaxID=180675 RepID=A0A8X8YU07_SALSN|nr:hypothetical protein SASPL_100999 [Salvia splendens]
MSSSRPTAPPAAHLHRRRIPLLTSVVRRMVSGRTDSADTQRLRASSSESSAAAAPLLDSEIVVAYFKGCRFWQLDLHLYSLRFCINGAFFIDNATELLS